MRCNCEIYQTVYIEHFQLCPACGLRASQELTHYRQHFVQVLALQRAALELRMGEKSGKVAQAEKPWWGQELE